MNLLIVAAMEPRLAALFNDNAHLTESLFDKTLYAHKGSDRLTDFLAQLVRSEFGGNSAVSGTGLLSKFATDLERLYANVRGMTAQSGVQKALTVAAMEYYYFKDPAAATQLFAVADGGLHFNYADIGEAQFGLKSPRRLADAMKPYLSTDEWARVGHELETQDGWHIQSGDTGMTWTASAAAYDAAIGGAQTDVLDGGSGADGMYGGAGDDILFGGDGDDWFRGDGNTGYFISAAYTDEFGVYHPEVIDTSYTPDWLHGADVIDGGAGNDEMAGDGNDDTLYGGDDNDRLNGDSRRTSDVVQDLRLLPIDARGDDWLDGGPGDDELIGDAGGDTLFGATAARGACAVGRVPRASPWLSVTTWRTAA
jgi:Ca2+-binding RTX toxin-like protein